MNKRCSLCCREKNLKDFYLLKTGVYGRYSQCKECLRQKQRNRGRWPRNTKYCFYCQAEKHIREFGRNRATRDNLTTRCRICTAARRTELRMQNPIVYQAQTSANRKRKQQWLRDIKVRSGCIRCGFSNPYALVFHHRDPHTKSFIISNVSRSQQKMLKEIEKCDVLCANCHSIEHTQPKDSKTSQPLNASPVPD